MWLCVCVCGSVCGSVCGFVCVVSCAAMLTGPKTGTAVAAVLARLPAVVFTLRDASQPMAGDLELGVHAVSAWCGWRATTAPKALR